MIDRLLKSMVSVAMVLGLTLTAGVLLLRHHQTAFRDGVEAAGVLTGVEAVVGARTTRYVATYTFVTADGREYSVRDLQAERSPRPGGHVHTISYRPADPAGARVVRTWTRSTAFLALAGVTLTGAASACLLVDAWARVRRWAKAGTGHSVEMLCLEPEA